MSLSARQISRARRGGKRFPPREARLICWAPEVFMQWRSRQQFKFQALLVEWAHCFRRNLSENECILWSPISGKRLGVAFRRQMPIGKYIVDFVAPNAKVIVEVDDRSHELKRTADARRDRNLGRLGYRVLWISAALAWRTVEGAVALIIAALQVAI
jgi:very-short-patch-repair endonuclease